MDYSLLDSSTSLNSRNHTRLVDYRQGAWQEKSRGIHHSTSLLTHNVAVAELWRLVTLGITEPAETL